MRLAVGRIRDAEARAMGRAPTRAASASYNYRVTPVAACACPARWLGTPATGENGGGAA